MSGNFMTPRNGLAFATLGIVWGAPFLLVKIAVRGIAAVDVAWCELTLGAAALLLIAAISGELGSVRGRWRAIGALALLQLAVPSLLTAVSERRLPSALAGTLNATTPLLVVPLAPLFGLRKPLHARGVVGLLAGFVGVVVLLGFDLPKDGYEWAGVFCMLAAALSYAAAPLLIQRHLHGVQGLGPSAVSLTIASAVLLPAALAQLPDRVPSSTAIASLAALGVICTGGGMLLYFFLVQEIGAARASVVKYLNPGIAAILGTVVLGESFPPTSVIGLIMILIGSWLATRDWRMRAQAKITVHGSEARCYEQGVGPALREIRISETFSGDIAGESRVRPLEVLRDDQSASMVSVQRVDGTLGGRRGTFVLQGAETVTQGRIAAKWFVVPGSGTGDLAGLRGEGGFEGSFGQGSRGTLDYWFEQAATSSEGSKRMLQFSRSGPEGVRRC